jgi:hypothetical protein
VQLFKTFLFFQGSLTLYLIYAILLYGNREVHKSQHHSSFQAASIAAYIGNYTDSFRRAVHDKSQHELGNIRSIINRFTLRGVSQNVF